jgi:hypothetical protein
MLKPRPSILVSLQGMIVIWKAKVTGTIKGEFIDVVLSVDNKENADSSFCALTADLENYKTRHPTKDHADFLTDRAGCYSGFDFLVHLTKLVTLVDIKAVNHYLFESGCGNPKWMAISSSL